MIAAIYPEIIYQHGLLATPFHRVYFLDQSLKVENLPKDRIRVPISLKFNYFAGNRSIIKPAIGFYTDNFGIVSTYIELEGVVKINPVLSLSAFAKGYHQSASMYFQVYGQHNPADTYYTSDYDLSKFSSIKTGVSIRWAPYKFMSKKSMFDALNFRYSFFMRTNQLKAHMFTLSFFVSRFGKQNSK